MIADLVVGAFARGFRLVLTALAWVERRPGERHPAPPQEGWHDDSDRSRPGGVGRTSADDVR